MLKAILFALILTSTVVLPKVPYDYRSNIRSLNESKDYDYNPEYRGFNAKLQSRLKMLGYYKGDVDGNIGVNTINAIKIFQKKNGMNPTGIINQNVIDALKF